MQPREFLRLLMARDGLTPTSLSRETRGQTKQPQIYRFLSGEAKEPKRSTLQPVADHFGVPVDALFDPALASRIAMELGLASGAHPPDAQTSPLFTGEARHLSPYVATVRPKRKPLNWEDIELNTEQTFHLAVRDMALSPDLRPGDIVMVDRKLSDKAAPGDLILARDDCGHHYLRVYRERKPGDWSAVPINSDFDTLHCTKDSLTIVGVVVEETRARRRSAA